MGTKHVYRQASFKRIDDFVAIQQLNAGDVIIVQKAKGVFAHLLNHYVVYLGYTGYEHKFVANMNNRGVDWLHEEELLEFSSTYVPTEIRRFSGSEYQRDQAIVRAVRAMNKGAYNLLTNNCEHLANYVQHGIPYSSQTQVAGGVLAAAGLSVAVGAKNDNTKLLGLFAMFLGGAIAVSEGKDIDKFK